MPTSSSPSLHISKSTIPRKTRAKNTRSHTTDVVVVDQHLMKIQQDLSYKVIAGNGSILVNKVCYRECRKNHAASVGSMPWMGVASSWLQERKVLPELSTAPPAAATGAFINERSRGRC